MDTTLLDLTNELDKVSVSLPKASTSYINAKRIQAEQLRRDEEVRITHLINLKKIFIELIDYCNNSGEVKFILPNGTSGDSYIFPYSFKTSFDLSPYSLNYYGNLLFQRQYREDILKWLINKDYVAYSTFEHFIVNWDKDEN